MKNMIETEGAKVVFPTSFGYFDPHILAMADKYPGRAVHARRRPVDRGKHPKNVHSYFGYIDECQYLTGIVAGNTTKSKKLGFVAAKPIPQVLRNINAFTLGARPAAATTSPSTSSSPATGRSRSRKPMRSMS